MSGRASIVANMPLVDVCCDTPELSARWPIFLAATSTLASSLATKTFSGANAVALLLPACVMHDATSPPLPSTLPTLLISPRVLLSAPAADATAPLLLFPTAAAATTCTQSGDLRTARSSASKLWCLNPSLALSPCRTCSPATGEPSAGNEWFMCASSSWM